MGVPDIWTADAISREAFHEVLARYPAVLQAASEAKGAKPGQPSLAELDAFRYEAAPARFGLQQGAEPLGLEDVQTLVAWKLRHGQFRPTLMKLVSSNDDAAVRLAVREALQAYEAEEKGEKGEKKDTKDTKLPCLSALVPLCRLRGIGPATASLLLAVHDPQQVPFFSDEAYAWLCGGPAQTRPSRYNEREYEHLCRRVADVQRRLSQDDKSIRAVDVEKVAYVLLKTETAKKTSPAREARQENKTETRKKRAPPDAEPPAAASGTVRRSRRIRRE